MSGQQACHHRWAVAELLEGVAAVRPDADALVHGDRRVSWRELDRHVLVGEVWRGPNGKVDYRRARDEVAGQLAGV